LLAEAGSAGAGHELVSVDARGAEAPADWGALRSPENYTGYERTENLASPGGAVPDKRHAYTAPAELRLNHWALSGDWTMQDQAATVDQAGGQIAYRFHARDLHLVMGPAVRGTSARFRVLLDGHPPGPRRLFHNPVPALTDQATSRDPSIVPSKQRVAGSDPAGRCCC
jgi:hypothetical protein